MKSFVCAVMTASSLLTIHAPTATAKDTYYPYQMYDDYHKTHSVEPPPGYGPPPTPPPPATQEQRPLAKQPLLLTEPPEFLFPPGLGFGVAVGIPYDLFYVPKVYYLYKDGSWFRSASYRGPWTRIGITAVPPELRRQKLAKVRELRNAEFARYWKNKSGYGGKVFRPDDESPQPQKKSPPPAKRSPNS